MSSMLKNKQVLVICILLAAAALMAFWQVNRCDFINFDDPLYVTENTHIMQGITWEAVRWAFTSAYANFWHPLTMISHMVDVQLFGLNPHGHHMTSLLFHIANTLLLFLILDRMTEAPWKSAFVAALFALHPLHVESVAWVAERKDVLSTFFWMLTMIAYVFYVERPQLKSYLATFALFILGMMAKPMLVTLPFVMLLLDYWPLQRLEQKKAVPETRTEPDKPVSAQTVVNEARPAVHKYGWAGVRSLLIEKIPFFALIPLFSVLTYIAEGEAVKHYPMKVRISNAPVSYFIYIGKMIWPANLAVWYPHPGLWPLWQAAGAALLLGAVTAIVIMTAKRFPYLAFGWLWFVGTLVPVTGIVQIGGHGRADRYTYIPLIGLFVMIARGIPELLKKWQPTRFPTPRKEMLFALSALVLLSLFIVTRTQVGYWRNNIALYDHSLKVSPSDVIYCSRGLAYGKLGDNRQAISDYDRAIEINPKDVESYSNRGVAYRKLGNYRRAIEDYDRAIEINPKHAEAYYNRGIAYAELGNQRQAISDYDRAIVINPEYANAYNNRGATYGKLGDKRQAISDYDRAIEINPEYAEAYNNRGATYGKLGDKRRAISDYDRAIEINPKRAEAYYNRGIAYAELGYDNKAIEDMQKAARLDNDEAKKFLRSRGIKWW